MTLHPIDWQELITDLHRARLRAATIASRVGVVRTTVIAIRDDGRTPLYPTGEHLIQLWCETTHKDRAYLPRISAHLQNVN